MDREAHFGSGTPKLWSPYNPSSWMHLGSTDMAEEKPVPNLLLFQAQHNKQQSLIKC